MNKNKFEKYFKKYSYNINKIVGVNPFDFNELYSLEDRRLSKIRKKNVKQEHLISTYIPNKNVITYEFKIQKNLLDKIELYDYIETKSYEEVGLDEAEEYIFKYKLIESEADTKNVLIEVVIVSKKELGEFFSPIKEEYGYLDYLTYPGFVFNVLYQEKILEPQNDLYIYFTKDDIFITLYSEGKFLQTFIIPEGLENIYDELMESIKIKNFNFELFMQLLIQKGLDLNNYNEKEQKLFNTVSELFSNKFLIISNQLHTIIRKFSLTTIDRIFMGTPKGVIPGISEFANMYLGVEANDLKFDIDYNPENIEIDQILFLSMLYASSAYKNDNQQDNFTIYYRPPTFFYRKSGQLISISIATIIIALMYPTYQVIESYLLEAKKQELQQTFNTLKKQNRKLRNENKKITKTLETAKEKKEKIIKYIDNLKLVIKRNYIEKRKYIPKAEFLAMLVNYLHDNEVYVSEIDFSDVKKVVANCNVNYNSLKKCWVEIKKPIEKKEDKKHQKKKKSKKVVKKIKEPKKEKGLIENAISLKVYSKSSQNITNFINDIIKNQHLVVYTPGYKIDNKNYEAQIVIKVGR